MRRYTYIFMLAVIALYVQGMASQYVNADEQKDVKAGFDFNSILPQHKEYEDEDKDEDYVDFANISDEALQKKLKALRETSGYNCFESRKSALMTALPKKTIEYRLDDSMDFYCKVTLKKVEKWIDNEDEEHTYITFFIEVVERLKDNEGEIIEKKVIEIELTRESGNYLLLIFRNFYPETEEKSPRDLILAVKAQA